MLVNIYSRESAFLSLSSLARSTPIEFGPVLSDIMRSEKLLKMLRSEKLLKIFETVYNPVI